MQFGCRPGFDVRGRVAQQRLRVLELPLSKRLSRVRRDGFGGRRALRERRERGQRVAREDGFVAAREPALDGLQVVYQTVVV